MLGSYNSCGPRPASKAARRELLEEIVRSYLVLAPRRSNSLGEFFEGLERRRKEGGVEPLSEEEAISLANEELHVMRRERRVAP